MNSKDMENGLKGIMSMSTKECMTGIQSQKNRARDAVHLKGLFKGKKRDEALADAIIALSDTQEKTIFLVQELIKFFGYAFAHLEG